MTKDGKPLDLRLVMWNLTGPLGEYMQEQLKNIGVESTVKSTDIDSWVTTLFTKKNYDLSVYAYYSSFPNPAIIPAQDEALGIENTKYYELSAKAAETPSGSECPAWNKALTQSVKDFNVRPMECRRRTGSRRDGNSPRPTGTCSIRSPCSRRNSHLTMKGGHPDLRFFGRRLGEVRAGCLGGGDRHFPDGPVDPGDPARLVLGARASQHSVERSASRTRPRPTAPLPVLALHGERLPLRFRRIVHQSHPRLDRTQHPDRQRAGADRRRGRPRPGAGRRARDAGRGVYLQRPASRGRAHLRLHQRRVGSAPGYVAATLLALVFASALRWPPWR